MYVEKRGGPRTKPWASSMWRGWGDVEELARGLRGSHMRWEKLWKRVCSAGSQVTSWRREGGTAGDENETRALSDGALSAAVVLGCGYQ